MGVVVACVDSCRTRCRVSSNICWSIGFLRKADGSFVSNFRLQIGGSLSGGDHDRNPLCMGIRPQTFK